MISESRESSLETGCFFVGKNVDKLWTSMLKTRRNLLTDWGQLAENGFPKKKRRDVFGMDGGTKSG